MEALQQKHRKELRDLTAQITNKKKSATKKTRRGILAECDALEASLKARQLAELAALDGPAESSDTEAPEPTDPEAEASPLPDLTTLTISEPKSEPTPPPPQPEPSQPKRKPNRQKARLARRAAETTAAIEAATAEASSLPNLRKHEQLALQSHFTRLSLREHDITPDGHCLYSAFWHQLTLLDLQPKTSTPGYKFCRDRCAAFMEDHRDDFEPFVELEGVEGGWEGYVKRVRETAEWGGQLEVLALARAFGVTARIVQAEGRVEVLNEDAEVGKEVWLAYYRHVYGLGEHYNSLVRVGKEE